MRSGVIYTFKPKSDITESPQRYFTFTITTNYLQLDCQLSEQDCKEDLIHFLQAAKPVLKEYSKSKLLVVITSESNVDIDTWSLLTKIKFENAPFKIAVLSGGIHQALLLNKLSQLNNNIKAFTDKGSAVQWLMN